MAGRRWLLSLPLSSSAIQRWERVARGSEASTPNGSHPTGSCRAKCGGAPRRVRSCAAIWSCSTLPEGLSFREALCRESTERLLSASTRFARRSAAWILRMATSGIRISAGRADASSRCATTTPASGIPKSTTRHSRPLRERILRGSRTDGGFDVGRAYNPLLKLTGHRWVHPDQRGAGLRRG